MAQAGVVRSGRTGARWWIAVLMWAAIAINYIDRTNLSAAAPQIAKDLHLTPEQMGIVFSAFFWSYALFQIPAGWLADRVGHRISLALAGAATYLFWLGKVEPIRPDVQERETALPREA